MVQSGPPNDPENSPQTLRNELVATAVKFLQNPRVAKRPRSEKELFLQKKGLTDAEIVSAFEAAGIVDPPVHYSTVQVAQLREYSSLAPVPRSKWIIIRDILNAAALFAGVVYSLHYLYRRFIAPFLFGKKQKSLSETVEEMNQNMVRLVGDVSAAVQNLSETVATLQAKQNDKSEMKELKAEVASLKALLLGRRQFPAPPPLLTGPPTIPSWQMSTSSSDKLDLRSEQNNKHQNDGVSLSSSPEIISVEDMANSSVSLQKPGTTSSAPPRDPSESSESNSAEIVEMVNSGSGGSGEDTD
nr:EOG090X0FQ8 [Macrothrix elegans]